VEWVAGLDEAGRGALCGPVAAAVVCLPRGAGRGPWRDSKTLGPRRREELARLIRSRYPWALGWAEPEEIDRLNVRRATILAMVRALRALETTPSEILVDGDLHLPVDLPQQSVVRGDATVPAIAAASILAKVSRDELMIRLDGEYPLYGMAGHKGYGTKKHLEALRRWGPTPVHRRSFAPVRQGRLWP